MRRRRILSAAALGGLVPFLPGKARAQRLPALSGYRITRWQADPFARGSYSYLARGARLDQRRDLAAPVGQTLFFAGEATNSDHPSTVHGALLSGQRAAREVAGTGARRVAVVGLGAAGLGAAQALAAQGLEVTAFEARDRLGGRVWSDHALGVPVDLGAFWIHGAEGNPLTQLAQETGTRTIEAGFEPFYMFDHRGWTWDEDDVPDAYWDHMTEQSWAADLEDLSADAEEDGIGFGGPDLMLPDGYDLVFRGLQGAYETRLSSPVDEIRYDGLGVALTVGGTVSTFDAAVVTVSLGVLKADAIGFTPPLPAPKRDAIRRLGMGLMNKTVLRFERPFWDTRAGGFGYLAPEIGWFGLWLNLMPVVGAPILVGFNVGREARALETRSDDAQIAEALAVLAHMPRG